MPRYFPSQIADDLRKIFGAPREFDQAAIQSYVESVAGVLHLYDDLPPELIHRAIGMQTLWNRLRRSDRNGPNRIG
jgi:hypothetical protein